MVIYSRTFTCVVKNLAIRLMPVGKQFGSLNVQSDEFKGSLMDAQMEVIGIGATIEDVVGTTSAFLVSSV